MRDLFLKLQSAVAHALAHDIINTAKAAAYSSMLMLFPALLVVTTLMAQVQPNGTALGEVRSNFEQFLPPDTLDLLQSYLSSQRLHSVQVILSASALSIFAALGVMLTLMEGFRRAYRLPSEAWGFWAQRTRALLLVPMVLVPLAVATMVIVFGRQIETWMIAAAGHDLRHIVLFFFRMARWSISIATSVTVLAALYHFGTRRTEHWGRVIPGALAGTLMWFPATLAFGWYVTRDENYSRFYGSFAAGIATLVWLYLTAFIVLLGAELNGALYWDRHEQTLAREAAQALPETAEAGRMRGSGRRGAAALNTTTGLATVTQSKQSSVSMKQRGLK
jgi:membrane protein